ncbi:hypothetical protein DI53_3462 [Sphingobacterium deserti]|uniref:Uncharacterized protein n=1 Tax=Sphingobacterium deserti TaxID=1229276 RepID=A0A0B8T1W9_9SPHI|nr:hypothetical protein DI53_3462 [Sphingobacterium deserti]
MEQVINTLTRNGITNVSIVFVALKFREQLYLILEKSTDVVAVNDCSPLYLLCHSVIK